MYCTNYIMLHLTFIFYNLFKGKNSKVKLESYRLWQLDNSWRKGGGRD